MGVLLDKLRLCGEVLRGTEATGACGVCGGTDTTLRYASGTRHNPTGPDGILIVYEAEVVCNECGAVGNTSRIWRLPGPLNRREGHDGST